MKNLQCVIIWYIFTVQTKTNKTMKTLKTKIYKVNGQWDVYANENTVRTQSFSEVALELGRNWNEMTSRQKSNFRKRHTCKPIPTAIDVYEVTATVPEIFSSYQLQEAAISAMIHNRKTLFLECKNGKTGYETSVFDIVKSMQICN